MDYKKEIIEMIEKADHDQLYTIFRYNIISGTEIKKRGRNYILSLSFIPLPCPLKRSQVSEVFPILIHLD